MKDTRPLPIYRIWPHYLFESVSLLGVNIVRAGIHPGASHVIRISNIPYLFEICSVVTCNGFFFKFLVKETGEDLEIYRLRVLALCN